MLVMGIRVHLVQLRMQFVLSMGIAIQSKKKTVSVIYKREWGQHFNLTKTIVVVKFSQMERELVGQED